MRASIRKKLLLLSVLPALLAVVLVGAVLTTRQTAHLSAELTARTQRYAAIAAVQLRSAIAFDDRETAREVLDAMSGDDDIVGLQLRTGAGAVLYTRGETVAPKATAVAGVAHRVDGRFVIEMPIVALEGAHGSIVIALSAQELDNQRRSIIMVTAAVGLLASLIAFALAMPIARRMSRRIGGVARYATQVAQGDLAAEKIDARGGDEVAQTATAVNTMVTQLQDLMEQEAKRAATERERLETMVAQRTRELAASHAATRLVLDHVNQGMLTVTHAGVVVGERSRATEALLGPIHNAESFAEIVGRADARVGGCLALAFDQLVSDILPFEVSLGQFPAEVAIAGRTLELAYMPIVDPADGGARLLVTITDVTAERENAHAREAEAESAAVFRQVSADRNGLKRFFDDARAHIATIGTATSSAEVYAALHTLKGNAGLMGLEAWAKRCHAAESVVSDAGDLPAEHRRQLQAAWAETEARVAPMLATSNNVEIARADFEAIVSCARREGGWSELRNLLRDTMLESTAKPLHRLAEHCRELAVRYGRPVDTIEVDDRGLRLDPEHWSPLWSALTHIVRNVVVHGMSETTATKVTLRTVRESDGVVIEIADTGRGIQWESLRERARAAGMPCETRDDLIAAMFASRISTRDTVDETAGRGVGLAAVAATCRELGVAIEVTPHDPGTAFRFHLPAAVVTGRIALRAAEH